MAILFLLIVNHTSRPDLPRDAVDRATTAHPLVVPGADKEGALRITVQRDGRVFFNHQPIPLEKLTPTIRIALVNGAERHVYIDADGKAFYGTVSEVVDAVKAAGVEKISFLTQPPVTPESSH